MECLLGLVKAENSQLRLIQEFVVHNPSRLPSPAQWVTIKRIRVVDSYTHVWWLAKTDDPKADNSKVLRPYGKAMKNLLSKRAFNSGSRPSGHHISSEAFLKNNGGSIAHNIFEMDSLDGSGEPRLPYSVLRFSNTTSNDYFHRKCREKKIALHPARMHGGLVNFFVEFLTDEQDLVLDPFAGSNTTGYCAELLRRNWISVEINEQYANDSMIRFEDPKLKANLRPTKLAKI
jgi:site-specific DNA-methyltransferase (cytosine-N4-specific)